MSGFITVIGHSAATIHRWISVPSNIAVGSASKSRCLRPQQICGRPEIALRTFAGLHIRVSVHANRLQFGDGTRRFCDQGPPLLRERHHLNQDKHPAACTCWACDLAGQRRRGLDPALPAGQQVSDSVIKDAESILGLTRAATESRSTKRAKSKQARDAAKRQRNAGGRSKKGKKR